MTDKDREVFESEMHRRNISTEMRKDAWGRDVYQFSHVEMGWEVWKACAAHYAPKLTEKEAVDAAFRAANPLIAVVANSSLPANIVRDAVQRAVVCALKAAGVLFKEES